MGIEYNVPLTQYAVEVPGKGFFAGFNSGLVDDPAKYATDDLEFVFRALDGCQKTYERLGMPEVGATARIVEYTVTLTRSECRPLSPGSSSGTTE